MTTSVLHGTPHRITYDDCYTNEYAALKAEKLLGEKRYKPLNRNCEHSSHHCKTGLVKSDQVKSCFSSVAKTLLASSLRLLNVLLLWVFQIIHEEREQVQIDRKAFERFEQYVTGAYMAVVFLLFSAWCMYTECNKLKPTAASKHCCGRPPRAACGLSIRIVFREFCAAAGPFALLCFEDMILPQEQIWSRQAVVFFTLLAVTIVSYMFGAVGGTLLEYCKCCVSCCVTSSTQMEQNNEEEIPPDENPQTETPL